MPVLRRLILVAIFVGSAAGCAAIKPENAMITPSVHLPVLETAPRRLDGAIYAQNVPVGLFSDFRARNVGDVVTVNIVETSSASKTATTKTGRSTSVEAGVQGLFGLDTALENKNAKFSADTMVKGGIKSDFDGSGSTTRDSSISASIACRVVAVLTNGDLAISGGREIRVNNEKQFMTLTGIIRPKDVATDNSVLSSYVADAHIEYGGRGVISEKQEPGWLARILDYVWPL